MLARPHYGILSNRNRSTKLQKCKELTDAVQIKSENSDVRLSALELLLKLTGIDINICSCCGKGKMITKEKLDRQTILLQENIFYFLMCNRKRLHMY